MVHLEHLLPRRPAPQHQPEPVEGDEVRAARRPAHVVVGPVPARVLGVGGGLGRVVPPDLRLVVVPHHVLVPRGYSGSEGGLVASFHQISVSSLYRTTYWSRAAGSISQLRMSSLGTNGGGTYSPSSSGTAMNLAWSSNEFTWNVWDLSSL